MSKSDKLQKFLSEKKNISLLYIIVSICILLLAFWGCTPEKKTEEKPPAELSSQPLAKTLETVLSGIRNVDRVQVALTYETGPTLVPVRDEDGDSRTVVTVGSAGNETVITETEIMPAVRGVVVVAGGAEKPGVQADIVAAVQALTGAPIHSIAVFPAK